MATTTKNSPTDDDIRTALGELRRELKVDLGVLGTA